MNPTCKMSRTPPMSKLSPRKKKRFRRFALRCGGVLAWVALVYFLPPTLSNVVAAIGLTVGVFAYFDWAQDSDETSPPTWACTLAPLQTRLRYDSILSEMPFEIRAKVANEINRRTLLHPLETEGCPEQELLRPTTTGKADPPEEMLRNSEKPE